MILIHSYWSLLLLLLLVIQFAENTESFHVIGQHHQQHISFSTTTSKTPTITIGSSLLLFSSTIDEDLDTSINQCLDILYKASETKAEDTDIVYTALVDLEKLVRKQAKDDESIATTMLQNLNGDWQLVFTTGTANTQKNLGGGRINYFPLKAVQKFRTINDNPMTIENGIYFGDFPAIKFNGYMTFDLRKRQLEFDFNQVLLLNLFNITLQSGDAANFGAKTGLGSQSNIINAKKKKLPFFNWINANTHIATARGGGGGLALWKRI